MLATTPAFASFPALSSAVPETTRPTTSSSTVTGAGHDATPERSSSQSKLMVTGARHQCAPFAGADGRAAIVGGCRSRLIVVEADALLPAASVASPVTS